MAMIPLAATSNTNLTKTMSLENRNNLRDASFSSYLNGAEENFVFKLAESGRNLNFLVSNPNEHLYVGRNKVEDGEIDVFGAEKYFNEENPKIANKVAISSHQEKDEPVDICPVKPKTRPGTPSVHSESSWNSQSALLHSSPKNKANRMAKKLDSKSFLAGLGCNCACSDKNSVEIDEQNGENSSSTSAKNGVDHGKSIANQPFKTDELLQTNKSQPDYRVKEEMQCQKFSFPVLNTREGTQVLKRQSDAAQKSLDVFGSPILQRGKKSLSLERRLTMLTWDAVTPRVEETEISANSNGIYNDTESDASSDLFEIESFSTNGRQASDGMSNCVTPRNYAPSEASVEWSVVTASAADFSVMSDSEERNIASSVTNSNRKLINDKTAPGKEMQKRRPSILLSCKSHKAVRVAGEAYRRNDKAKTDLPSPQKLDSFQAERKLTGLGNLHGQRAFNPRSLSRSHSGRVSRLMHIQQ